MSEGRPAMSFDKKLKTLRLENNMTQESLARRINVARSTIAGYETKNRQPSHEKLTALAGLFHVTVDYLLDDSNPEEPVRASAPSQLEGEHKLLARYRSLSLQSKKDLLAYIHLLELRDQEQIRV